MRHIKTLIELWRGKAGASSLHPGEIQRIGKALLTLQRGLTGKRELAGAGYMDRAETLGAYLLYYFPVSYEQIRLEFEHVLRRHVFAKGRTLRILDVGAGPGPASAAIVDTLLERGQDPSRIQATLIDSSAKALRLATELLGRDCKGIQVQTQVKDLEKDALACESGAYDIVVMSHVVNELWGSKPDALKRRAAFLKHVSTLLSPEGVLLLSEPALLETSRALLALIPKLDQAGLGVLAPCPLGVRHCPIFETGVAPTLTCHAEVPWEPEEPMKSLAKAAGLDRESVKMAFLALQHREALPKEDASLRVVSDGMLNKSGRVRFLLCDGTKRIALSAKATDPKAREIGFYSLSRFDAVRLEQPELRGDAKTPAWGVGVATELHIERFAPKVKRMAAKILQIKRNR